LAAIVDSLTFPGELDCTDCALSKMRTNVVPGALGERYDGVFIVGEAPGPDENERGFPFVGPSGRSMGEMLQEHGLHRSMFFFTNVAKCWPHVMGPKGRWQTIPPKIEEIRACFPRWFLQELHKLKPHTIVSLGGNALQAFLPGGKIGNVHGRTLNCIIDDYGEVKLIPLYHPAAAMHNPDLDVKVRADFAALPELLGAEAERDESTLLGHTPSNHLTLRMVRFRQRYGQQPGRQQHFRWCARSNPAVRLDCTQPPLGANNELGFRQGDQQVCVAFTHNRHQKDKRQVAPSGRDIVHSDISGTLLQT